MTFSACRGISYWVGNKLHLQLTSRTTSIPAPLLRGPSFSLPYDSNFSLLQKGFEPSSEDIVSIINDAFEKGKIGVDSMTSDEITFAGYGEPLLRLDCIGEVVRTIRDSRHGTRFRVKTNGLILTRDCNLVAQTLIESGLKHVSIALMADNPKLYHDIVKPTNGAGFGDVCSFTIACVEAGLNVTCTAVEMPGVNIRAVRLLSESLGSPSFESYSYHP